ncbi:hypothetical protein PG988_007233 [Apiospora saccharicola]
MPLPSARPTSDYRDYQLHDDPALQSEADEGFPRSTALCRHLWPSAIAETIEIEYLGMGCHNQVLGLSFIERDETKGGREVPHDLVLRITSGQKSVLPTVAILQYLEMHTSLKVPRVIKYDTTRDNPLGFRYIILSRIPGWSLNEIWDHLTDREKHILAAQLATLYSELESVTSSVAGHIMVHQEGFVQGHCDIEDFMFLKPLVTPDHPSSWGPETVWLNNKDRMGLLDRIQRDPPGLSVEAIMHSVVLRRLYRTKGRGGDIAKYEAEKQTVQCAADSNLFNPNNDVICLHHPDLHPGNIMVNFTTDDIPVITGVVDWDSASFVPRYATRVIPEWLLWDNTDDYTTDECYIIQSGDYFDKVDRKHGMIFGQLLYWNPESEMYRSNLQLCVAHCVHGGCETPYGVARS